MSNLKRLYLLSDAEIDELYARPIFNQEERELYFDLNKAELDALGQLTTTVSLGVKSSIWKNGGVVNQGCITGCPLFGICLNGCH